MNETNVQINQKASAERFQILSLDGGGIKGLFSAALLAAIEEDLHINIVDIFDFVRTALVSSGPDESTSKSGN